MKVTILHNSHILLNDGDVVRHNNPETDEPCGPFWNLCSECALVSQARYEVPVSTTLEDIFERENIGSHPGRRSLSVGDVVLFEAEDGETPAVAGTPKKAFTVASFGFNEIDPWLVVIGQVNAEDQRLQGRELA